MRRWRRFARCDAGTLHRPHAEAPTAWFVRKPETWVLGPTPKGTSAISAFTRTHEALSVFLPMRSDLLPNYFLFLTLDGLSAK